MVILPILLILILPDFNFKSSDFKEFSKMNDELYHAGWKAQFLSGIIHPLMRKLNFIKKEALIG